MALQSYFIRCSFSVIAFFLSARKQSSLMNNLYFSIRNKIVLEQLVSSRHSPYFKEPENVYCSHRTCHCLHPGLHESSLNPKISSRSALILSCHVCLPLRNAVVHSDSEIRGRILFCLARYTQPCHGSGA